MGRDPYGDFTVTIDEESLEIVVEHLHQGQRLNTYRAKSFKGIESQLVADCALSEVSHALYLGREIARAERLLRI